ncbi:unnamed protein product [Darwinula stevensoni]|uniref:Solute carrier family 25 member 32 n=1 Tax=Darwinula stevensoni TaxID=69355 RepID=A0A7R8X8E3_9CRUS|nr:unnamed protein product [Darwinula stevensoni]CAG0888656.1 unnamed protein product [Darwinula stevensoni]
MAAMKTKGDVHLSLFSHVRIEHLIAGMSGGAISTIILHPLDLIKIRFAVDEGKSSLASVLRPKYNGFLHAISSIYQAEGISGFYKGVTPNVVGSTCAWGLYFMFYNGMKTWMQEGDTRKDLGPGIQILLAAQSGVVTLALTNPIWVAKTRLVLQYERKMAMSDPLKNYSGFLDCLAKIYRSEGIRGYYKGFVPGIFGVSHGALQFMAYERLKAWYSTYYDHHLDTKLGTLEYLSFGALSKLFASSITYPYQVVRARLQDQHRQYGGVVEVAKLTWQYEGLRGFYKGLLPNLLRVTPATAITFVVYEKVSHFLMSKA